MNTWAVLLQATMVALTILQIWLYRRRTLILLRPVGRRLRIGHIYQTGVGLALAVSPVGAWFADIWQSAEIFTGVLGGLFLSIVMLVVGRMTAALPEYLHLPKFLLVLVGWIHNLFFFRQAPLALLVVFHRSPVPVLASACVLTAVATAALVHDIYVLRASIQHLLEAEYAMTLAIGPARRRAEILDDWLRHVVLRGPRKPNIQLLFFLSGWAEMTVKGLPWRSQSVETRKALLPYWAGFVEECIRLIEERATTAPELDRHELELTALGGRIRFTAAKAVVHEQG